jgi:Zn-finger protein
MEIFKMPEFIDPNVRYVICPDTDCPGFVEDKLRCENTKVTQDLFPNDNIKLCPHLDKAKMVVFCYWGHPIEFEVNVSSWIRADCKVKDCHSCTFSLGSNITHRIPLDKYEEFLKLPLKNKKL